jgi:glucose/mannose-6-phosphate isomerase
MLDDLKLIHERDAQDALGIAEKEWQQLEGEFEIVPKLKLTRVYNVVFAGMGGSALGALLVKTWPALKVPLEIVRDYNLPGYVDGGTLVVASSYSGNTEETLSALGDAEKRGAQIAVIAGGGKLAETAKQKGYPLVTLPKTSQPRYAALYNYKATVTILEQAGLVKDSGAISTLKQSAKFLKEAIEQWITTVPSDKNLAKKIALDVVGKSVVIYAGPLMFPAAYKWKISFNENAKNIAWCNQYPEFSHNEFIGWTSHPLEKLYAVIDLRSDLDHPQVQKRFEVTEKLLSGRRPAPIIVEAKGKIILEQLLWFVALGDFVSLYTAILNGLNPTPVDLIEKFKKELE